jgi:dihydroxyacetone kinase
MSDEPAAVAKGFVDDLSTVVSQAVSGLTRCSGGTLKHLTTPAGAGGAVHVVVRGDFEQLKASGKVAIVSGGGAGHEPLHAGFVGPDMLTAAVSGDIFASPSTDAVLHAIVTVTGTGGCLVVVKNYTGDRLNFGLAIERARSLHGLNVEMVVVADDVALPHLKQPRGIAGTCLVHKVAGYAADTLGRDLECVASRGCARRGAAWHGVLYALCAPRRQQSYTDTYTDTICFCSCLSGSCVVCVRAH